MAHGCLRTRKERCHRRDRTTPFEGRGGEFVAKREREDGRGNGAGTRGDLGPITRLDATNRNCVRSRREAMERGLLGVVRRQRHQNIGVADMGAQQEDELHGTAAIAMSEDLESIRASKNECR